MRLFSFAENTNRVVRTTSSAGVGTVTLAAHQPRNVEIEIQPVIPWISSIGIDRMPCRPACAHWCPIAPNGRTRALIAGWS